VALLPRRVRQADGRAERRRPRQEHEYRRGRAHLRRVAGRSALRRIDDARRAQRYR